MPNASLRAWNGTMPVPGSMCSRRIFSGSDAATSSMSMPPAALAMMTGAGRRAVDHDAQVQLALDLQPLLDEHAADLLAFRAGLVRDQRHADHLLGELLGLVGRLGQLDAAALAAAAGVNLRLDDTMSPPRRLATSPASAGENATSPRGTGTPKRASTDLA